jgi:hypothetical protein
MASKNRFFFKACYENIPLWGETKADLWASALSSHGGIEERINERECDSAGPVPCRFRVHQCQASTGDHSIYSSKLKGASFAGPRGCSSRYATPSSFERLVTSLAAINHSLYYCTVYILHDLRAQVVSLSTPHSRVSTFTS